MEIENILSLYRPDAIQFFGYRLGIAAKLYDRCVSRVVEQHGLNLPQWRVMAQLSVRPDSTIRALAEGAAADRAESSRAVRRLTELGFVQRQENASDSRSPVFSLTPQGREMFGMVQPTLDGLMADLVSTSERAEIETSALLLRHLTLRAATRLNQR